jgi:glycosyltransferase involved in cell wall biosynthesis
MLNKGWDVYAVAPKSKFTENLQKDGCTVLDLDISRKGVNPLLDAKLLLRLWNILRKSQPDVFLAFTVKPVIYGTLVAKLCGIRTINTITGMGTTFMSTTVLTRFVIALYRISQKWAEKVVFQNSDDQMLLQTMGIVSVEQTTKVPGSGIDLDRFSVAPFREDESFIFLFAGRLIWDKGIGEFIDAARYVKKTYQSIRFRVVGALDFDNRTAITNDQICAWEEENIIEYLGEVEDIRSLISQSDCIVLPSYREGLPRILLEGAAMGRPLIATDVPGCREVIEEGVTGYLCRVRDPIDLGEKCLRMYSLSPTQRKTIGLNARKMVEQRFDEKIVIDHYLDLIENPI